MTLKNTGPSVIRRLHAERTYSPGDTIEISPVVPLPPGQLECMRRTSLAQVCCCWNDGMAPFLFAREGKPSRATPNDLIEISIPSVGLMTDRGNGGNQVTGHV